MVPATSWWSLLTARADPATSRRVFADVMIWTSHQNPDGIFL
jgi:hypothetical protein